MGSFHIIVAQSMLLMKFQWLGLHFALISACWLSLVADRFELRQEQLLNLFAEDLPFGYIILLLSLLPLFYFILLFFLFLDLLPKFRMKRWQIRLAVSMTLFTFLTRKLLLFFELKVLLLVVVYVQCNIFSLLFLQLVQLHFLLYLLLFSLLGSMLHLLMQQLPLFQLF
jgi:hypothetical protein